MTPPDDWWVGQCIPGTGHQHQHLWSLSVATNYVVPGHTQYQICGHPVVRGTYIQDYRVTLLREAAT